MSQEFVTQGTLLALNQRELNALLMVHTTEIKYPALGHDMRALIEMGLIQRVSGTDIYELSDKGVLFLKQSGLGDMLVLNERRKVRDDFRRKVIAMIAEEMSNIAESSRAYYKRAIALINKMKTD